MVAERLNEVIKSLCHFMIDNGKVSGIAEVAAISKTCNLRQESTRRLTWDSS
jgi:hypothetical protein